MKATVTENGILLEAENGADNFVLKQFDRPNWIGIGNTGVEVNNNNGDKKRTMLIVPIRKEVDIQKAND
jgi:hypothetical protein